MKKFKIFYNPIEQIPAWLNKMADKGFRLISIQNFLYKFEKTDKKYQYSSQFIGYDSNKKNKDYIDMLEEGNFKTFRAPLNQLVLSIGKIRLRPLAGKGAKISTSFDNLNKEILIVESSAEKPVQLLTNNLDLANAYKKIRNAYTQAMIILLLLSSLIIFRFLKEERTISSFTGAIAISVFLVTFILTTLVGVYVYFANKKFKYFLNKSKINE